jgi:uncharacterized membrane protein
MIYILLAVLFYTVAIMLSTLASRAVNSNLVSALTNVASTIIPIAIVIPILNKHVLESSQKRFGIIMAILAGLAIGIFAIMLNKSYTENKVAIVAPIVFGGAIFLSAILSNVFLKERISLLQGIGLALLAAALSLIVYARMTGK